MKQRVFSPWSELRHQQRPRLLIEDPSPALEPVEFRRFEDSGFDVAWCSGPSEGHACPLEKGGDCRLVELADAVLMGPGMAGHRAEVAAAIQHRRPGIPIVVQIPRGDPAQCPPGCITEFVPASVDGQIRAVWRALDRRPAVQPVTAPHRPPDTPPPSTAETSTMARLVDLLGW
jgi:hypothetical protein